MKISELSGCYPDKDNFLSSLFLYYKEHGEVDSLRRMERYAIKYRDYVLRSQEVNEIARALKKEINDDLWLLDVALMMWKRDKGSDRFLGPKLIGRAVKKFPAEGKKTVLAMKELIEDWADCDGLIANAYKKYAVAFPEDVFADADKFVKSKNLWEKRFGIVSLIVLIHDRNFKNYKKILSVLDLCMADSEKYVKKAVSWAIKDMGRKDFHLVFEFLAEKAKTSDLNQRWVVRNAVEYFSKEDKEKIRKLINNV